jgi:hypothetical protein
VPAEAAGVLHRPTTLGEPLRPVLEGPQSGAVLREGGTLEELAFGFFDRSDGDRRFVWIDPDQDLHERTHLRFSRTSAIGVREGHSDFGPSCSHTSFESLRPPRAPAGRKPRTSQPTLRATGSSRAIPETGTLEA